MKGLFASMSQFLRAAASRLGKWLAREYTIRNRLLAAVFVVLLIWAAAMMFETKAPPPESADEHPAIRVERLPVADCDLAFSPCTVEIPGGDRLTVDFPERPLKPLNTFTVQATLETEADIRVIQLVLSGADMNMGTILRPLEKDATGQYRSEVVLPVCMSGAMRWRMDLDIGYEEGYIVASFIFSTGQN